MKLLALCLAVLCASASAQPTLPNIPNLPSLNFSFPGLPSNNGSSGSNSGGGFDFNITLPAATYCSSLTTVKLLNYALQLEFMQAEFWKQARAVFGSAGNATLGSVSAACRNQSNVLSRLETIESQDNAHASALNKTINQMCSSLSGDADAQQECYAVKPCTFNFSFTANSTDYNGILNKGIQLEDLIVQAYLGLIPQVLDDTVSTQLLSISTVDARHSAYVRQIGGQSPFPNVLDSPPSRTAIKCSLRQYVSNANCCPGWQRLKC